MNFDQFLKWEKASIDTIDFKKIYVDITDDLEAGLMLSQIIFWHLPSKKGESKLRVKRDDKFWLVKKNDDWWDECRLKRNAAVMALDKLKKLGLVESKVMKFDGVPHVHIRFISERFIELWEAEINRQNPDLRESVNPFTDPSDLLESVNGLTGISKSLDLLESVNPITETTRDKHTQTTCVCETKSPTPRRNELKQRGNSSGKQPKADSDRIENQNMSNIKPLFEGNCLSGKQPKADSDAVQLAKKLQAFANKEGYRGSQQRVSVQEIQMLVNRVSGLTFSALDDLVDWMIENYDWRWMPKPVHSGTLLNKRYADLKNQRLKWNEDQKNDLQDDASPEISDFIAKENERLIEQAQRRRIARGLPAVQVVPEDDEMGDW